MNSGVGTPNSRAKYFGVEFKGLPRGVPGRSRTSQMPGSER